MKRPLIFLTRALVSGVLIVIPIYLASLLLLKAATTVVGLVRPVAVLLPDWLPAELPLALLLVLVVCLVVGLAIRTRAGRVLTEHVERTFFDRVPGYALIRSLTQRMAGEDHGNVWRPALFEQAGGLMMAFIIEEFPDGRYTVFVPSIPAPLSGNVYIVAASRVHPLDVPFTEAIRSVSRWGAGARELVEAMERKELATEAGPDSASGREG